MPLSPKIDPSAGARVQVYDGPMEGKALQAFVTDIMPDHLTPEVMPETWWVAGSARAPWPKHTCTHGDPLLNPPAGAPCQLGLEREHCCGRYQLRLVQLSPFMPCLPPRTSHWTQDHIGLTWAMPAHMCSVRSHANALSCGVWG